MRGPTWQAQKRVRQHKCPEAPQLHRLLAAALRRRPAAHAAAELPDLLLLVPGGRLHLHSSCPCYMGFRQVELHIALGS
jgi:hypothetical protein